MHLFQLPGDLSVFEINRTETQFLHQEIFVERAYLRHGVTLRQGDCVFDVGANIGLFAIFASRVAPGITVHSFEPVPDVFKVLKANLALHKVAGGAHEVAVSDQAGTLTLNHYPGMTMMSGQHADVARDTAATKDFLRQTAPHLVAHSDVWLATTFTQQKIECTAVTLSQVIQQTGVTRIDLLKVDVERAELAVLRGLADADWPLVRQVSAELHDEGDCVPTTVQLLERHGFRVVVEKSPWAHEMSNRTLYAVRP